MAGTPSTVGQKDAEPSPQAARKPPADGRTAQGAFAKCKKGDLTGWGHKGRMPRVADGCGRDP